MKAKMLSTIESLVAAGVNYITTNDLEDAYKTDHDEFCPDWLIRWAVAYIENNYWRSVHVLNF